jgi:hypothetical protein
MKKEVVGIMILIHTVTFFINNQDDLPRFSNCNLRSPNMMESFNEDDIYRNQNQTQYMNHLKSSYRLANIDDENFEDDDIDLEIQNIKHSKKEEKEIGDKLDQLMSNKKENNYLSISDTSILSNNYALNNEMNNSQIHNNNYDDSAFNDGDLDLNMKNISNIFFRKSYIILYFELQFFMFWGGEYAKTLFEGNEIIIFFQINDDPTTSEKIFLIKSEEKYKYKPMLRKQDLKKGNYQIIKFLPLTESGIFQKGKRPIKLTVEVCIYSNGRKFSLSQDEIFFTPEPEFEMHKFQIYQNSYMKYNGKKMGNILFDFMFKLDKLNLEENCKHEEFHSKYLNMLSRKEKLQTYIEDPNLQLSYYDIPNKYLKFETSSFEMFASLKDIIDLDAELRTDKSSLDRLLQLLSTWKDYKKYDFYNLLKRLQNQLSKNEFNEEKIILFKERLNKILEDFCKANKESFDNIILPFIFVVLRKTFYRNVKVAQGPKGKGKDSASSSKSLRKIDVDHLKKQAQLNYRSAQLMVNVFKTSFHYIKHEFNKDIILSALNYIYKNIEENKPVPLSEDFSQKENGEEYFINFIVTNKKYFELCELLSFFTSEQACIIPVTSILVLIYKNRKEEAKEITKILSQDKFKMVFKDILNMHDHCTLIMNNIITILNSMLEVLKIEELFEIINFVKLRTIFYNFNSNALDSIHENILTFLKDILIKKSKTQSQLGDDVIYPEMINIYYQCVLLVKNKALILDLSKCVKSLFSFLNHLYNICTVINNINQNNEKAVQNSCLKIKMVDALIDCLAAFNNRRAYVSVDKVFVSYWEIPSINTKTVLFRLLSQVILFIQNQMKLDVKILVSSIK